MGRGPESAVNGWICDWHGPKGVEVEGRVEREVG